MDPVGLRQRWFLPRYAWLTAWELHHECVSGRARGGRNGMGAQHRHDFRLRWYGGAARLAAGRSCGRWPVAVHGRRLWPEPKPVRLSISGCESERDLRFRVFANGAVTGHVGLTANNLSQGQERITAVRFELRRHYRWRPSEKIANLDPKENPVSYGVQQGWPLPPANEPEERPAFFAVPLPCALSEGKTVHLHALAELGHEKRVVRAAIPIVVEED